ncbi:MAG: DUF493 domain-containing protein [Bdellovibrionota bacterium]
MPHPEEEARLVEILNQGHDWPTLFAFKFIVPNEQTEALKALVPEADRVEVRPSSGGKYMAFTFHVAMGSAKEVLALYARVRGVPGLISL